LNIAWIFQFSQFCNFPAQVAHKRGEGYKLSTTFTFYAEFPTYFMALISLFMAPSIEASGCCKLLLLLLLQVASCQLQAINASNSFSFGCLNELLSSQSFALDFLCGRLQVAH